MPNSWIFPVLLPIGITIFVLFNYILSIEYTQYQASWEQDGKPAGFFWSPPNANSESRASVLLSWLFKTPS